ncbi:MAG: VTT domain-containing protein [Gemmatimonadales bacterium]
MTSLLFKRKFGNPVWDGLLRMTGLVALLAIPLSRLVPAAGGMVGFAIVTIWVNGPISPLLPSTYEPMLMVVGRVYQPLLVAVVGTLGTIYVEYLNYHLYRRIMRLKMLERTRNSKTVERVLNTYSRAPFFAIWMCSWSIFPYWPVRFMSPLVGYDVRRHLLATFLGRFPRLWFFAALGTWWGVSVGALALWSAGSITLAVSIYSLQRRRGKVIGRRPELTALEVAEG